LALGARADQTITVAELEWQMRERREPRQPFSGVAAKIPLRARLDDLCG
jgi:hypothetical protein